MRRIPLIIVALPLLLAGCGGSSEEAITPAGAVQSSEASEMPEVPETVTEAKFEAGGTTAITYDRTAVPVGATVQVARAGTADGSMVRLSATGLAAERAYGAHLHTAPCAADPDAAGPHYQHQADPKKPSVDPAFANPDNEVWLDFTTDDKGAASSTAVLRWTFSESAPPRSLVLHAEETKTAAGEAGAAGARVACLTLPAA